MSRAEAEMRLKSRPGSNTEGLVCHAKNMDFMLEATGNP